MILLGGSIVLGIFLPIPGFVVSVLFWPAGIHDLDNTAESVVYLLFLFVVSALIWASLFNIVLPSRRE
jgi:hypothetical protein